MDIAKLYTKEGRPQKREQFLKVGDMKKEYVQTLENAQGQGVDV